ncbi:ankyrin repeat-containing domain protein, partial [Tribonema minus]
LVAAVRADDVAALRAMRDAGRCMSACNRFGESILHTAARRGSRAVVAFLLESGAPPGACDDCGRNALHQALWTAEPRFDVVTLLVNADVRLLRCVDKRGAPPLQYARPEHWELWCRFFHSKKHLYWP